MRIKLFTQQAAVYGDYSNFRGHIVENGIVPFGGTQQKPMKYIVLVGDGMAGRPLEELNGRTTLEASDRRYMDEIVKRGRIGAAITIPQGFSPGSDVANLAILGYDPGRYRCGRGPLEAANMGVDLSATDVAFRCNLVTHGRDTMLDYSAGHISSEEAKVLIEALDEKAGNETVRFYPGTSYRHLMVYKAGSKKEAEIIAQIKCAPPHDILNKRISENLPQGEGSEVLIALMEKSKHILEQEDVNKARAGLSKNVAGMIWPWGQGIKPNMPLFEKLHGVKGSIISAVDLIKGIGRIIGLEVINVPCATGYYDTNFKGKGEAAVEALKDRDFVFVHVEAPDEAGHAGDVKAKITAIENFDKFVVGAIWEAFKERRDFRILLLPDHATPISVRTHATDPVPFAMCGDGIEPDTASCFTETEAKAGKFFVPEAHLLMKSLVRFCCGKDYSEV
jgi:2,3-bisphosphoglycerate-independent phosphoglycerate mutase